MKPESLANIRAFLMTCGMTKESTVLDYCKSLTYKLRTLQDERDAFANYIRKIQEKLGAPHVEI